MVFISTSNFDVIIVVSSTREQADFWKDRLDSSELIEEKTLVYSINEEWEGGAGQLLGTLNAWNETCKFLSLYELIENGSSIAIYHTAGKGTRIAPLGLAEIDKGAVRLPRLVDYGGEKETITLLEAVIDQTSIFAESRNGRITVFWGDGLFLPSKDASFDGKSHVELFGIREKTPTNKEDWDADWKNYGIIILRDMGSIQREKQSWEEFNGLLEKGLIERSEDGSITLARSMGCFSISYAMFEALLEEYQPELTEKTEKLDTDPHLWMPMTASKEDFEDELLWNRVNEFKERFLAKDESGMNLFSDKDMGDETYWWDFGQLSLYHQNLLKLLEDSGEGDAMRDLFDVRDNLIKIRSSEGLEVIDSIVLDSEVKGRIEKSIVVKAVASSINADNSIIINSKVGRAESSQSVIYNCIELEDLNLSGESVVDLFHPKKGKIRMATELERDGKADWDLRVGNNHYTYSEAQSLLKKERLEEIKAEELVWEGYFNESMGVQFKAPLKSFIKPIPNLVEKSWGGSRIEILKQMAPSGRKVGESWECSAYPGNSSKIMVRELEVPLIHLLNQASDSILGEAVARKSRGEMPVLLKFIDSKSDLSVQVHPTDEQAEELGEVDSGKNESWMIIDSKEGSGIYLGFKEDVRDIESINVEKMNFVPVKPGDLFKIPAGTIHAIGSGIFLFEIQQSSDLTYRVWDWDRLPRRELHLKKAKKVINFGSSKIDEFKVPTEETSSGEVLLLDTPYFILSSINLDKGGIIEESTQGSFKILISLEGEVKVISEGAEEILCKGESLLVPASIDTYMIKATCDARILKSWYDTKEQGE